MLDSSHAKSRLQYDMSILTSLEENHDGFDEQRSLQEEAEN